MPLLRRCLPALLAVALLVLASTARDAHAADAPPPAGRDWPQFLGPARNGSYAGGDIPGWPAGGPKELWKVDVGEGWAGPVVVDGKVLQFHRVKDEAVLDCLDAATGKPVWSSRYPTDYVDGFGFDAGPRATPAVAGGKVFTFGAEGVLRAVDLATGKEVWKVDTVAKHKAQKGFFGLACSPLVVGDEVVVTLGGVSQAGAKDPYPMGTAAFAVGTGRFLWGSTVGVPASGQSEPSYASPTVATIGGETFVLAVARTQVQAIKADGGKLVAVIPFRSREHASVHGATPLVIGDEVFVSSSYGVGAKLFRLEPIPKDDPAEPRAKMLRPTVVWENDESMSNHYATCVVRDGLLYGFHGRQERGPELRCVEWGTGKVRWSQEGLGAGTVTLVGDKLLVLTEKGELVMAEASAAGFKELGRRQVLGAETRAYPAVAGGRVFARGKDRLVCLSLTEK
ncbi:MAG TPA: PQQ-binding-like beta-propeller repeat protein [Humisphaera sp.]